MTDQLRLGGGLGSLGRSNNSRGGHITKWYPWVVALAALVLLYLSSVSWPMFLVTLVGAVLVLIDCARHPANILRAAGYLLFGFVLSLNAYFGQIQTNVGRAVVDSATNGSSLSGTVGLPSGGQLPSIPAPGQGLPTVATTTVPAATPAALPSGTPR